MSAATPVLVTGAGGFIGSHLVERLVREGYRVRAFVHYNSSNNWHHVDRLPAEVRRELEVLPGDIADPFVVDRAVRGCELVFHLASLIAIPYSYAAPASYVSTNVMGTLHLMQACRTHGVRRVIHTSTSEVYGTARYEPIDEQHPLVGQSPYSASKIAADQLAESFHRSFELPVCVVRPFNTYGPRQSARAIIPTIVCQALAGQTVRLGNLDPVRDFTYVEDTVSGFLAAARSDGAVGETINLGCGSGVSVAELIERVGAILGRTLPVEREERRVRPERSEVMRLICDNRKAHSLIGWRPTVDLDAGLRRVVDYVSEHPGEYKPEVYNL